MFEIMKDNNGRFYILWYDKKTRRISRTGNYYSFKAALDAAERLRGDNSVQNIPRTAPHDSEGIKRRSEGGADTAERSHQSDDYPEDRSKVNIMAAISVQR